MIYNLNLTLIIGVFILDISTKGVHVSSPFANRFRCIRLIRSVRTNYIRRKLDQNTSTYYYILQDIPITYYSIKNLDSI